MAGPQGQGAAYFSSNYTITATAAGLSPLTYHWLKNGTNILTSSNAALILTNLDGSSKGNYSLVVSNANGTATTSTRPLTSINPVITQQPDSVTNILGGTATITAAVIGIPPCTYQWQKLGPTLNFAGATNLTLAFTNLAATNAGSYWLIIGSLGNASLITRSVALTVLTNLDPVAPILGAPLLVDGDLQFSLPTQSGFNYSVQSSTNLTDTNWVVVQIISGDGTVKNVHVGASATQNYFQVLVPLDYSGLRPITCNHTWLDVICCVLRFAFLRFAHASVSTVAPARPGARQVQARPHRDGHLLGLRCPGAFSARRWLPAADHEEAPHQVHPLRTALVPPR